MLKQAWYTYLAAIHPRNIKKVREQEGIFVYIYWLVVLPSMASNGTGDEVIAISFFWCTIFLPLMLMKWSNTVTKLHMPKEMFLSPMGMENRKKYIQAVILIKIGVPVAVGLILRIVYGILYGLEPLLIFASTFAICSCGIGMYICSEIRVKSNQLIRYAIRDKDGKPKESWLNWICMGISIVIMLGFDASGLAYNMTQTDWAFLIGGLFILLMLDIIIIKTQFRSTVEELCNYEIQFDVLNKV